MDMHYKKSLIKTMLHRAYSLSSSWQSVVTESATILWGCSLSWDTQIDWLMPPLPLFWTLSFWRKIKLRRTTPWQRETSFISYYLSKIRDLQTSSENNLKILATQYKWYSWVQKLASNLKFRRGNHLLLADNVLYINKFKCDLCDTDYIGYPTHHLHQRIEEHRASAVGGHVKGCHEISNPHWTHNQTQFALHRMRTNSLADVINNHLI